MGGFSDFFLGRGGRTEQVPTVTPQQKGVLDQILGGLGGQGFGGGALGSGLQNIFNLLSGDQGALDAFQAPAIRQFEEQTVPGIAERFSGLGAGAQRSSAFGQQLGAAGAGLAENLSAQRAGLQSDALSQLRGLLGMGLGPQFQNQQIPGSEGAIHGILQGLGSVFGGVGGQALGGGLAGALSGKGFGAGVKHGFGF